MLLRSHPVRLQRSFVRLSLLGILISISVGLFLGGFVMLWLQKGLVVQTLEDSRIWRDGKQAAFGEVSGDVTTNKFVFHKYELKVLYRDDSGRTYRGTTTFDTIFSQVPENAPVQVRYLESDPSQFALSWSMEMRTNRWIEIGLFCAMGLLLLGALCVMIPRTLLRRYFDAMRCLQHSNEVIVHLAKVVQVTDKGRHINTAYHYVDTNDMGTKIKGVAVFPADREPLFADHQKQTMIALVPHATPQRAVVLRDDLYPFEFPADDVTRIRTELPLRVRT